VFASSSGATEDTPVDPAGLGAYGRNRRWLEELVADRFAQHVIVRLPGLVGPGLRKNAIFDFRNNNNLHLIDARGVYQFYPMVNLWADLDVALRAHLRLVHFAVEPLSVGTIAARAFGREFTNTIAERVPASYDLRSRHGALFGSTGAYLYSARESLMAIRAYAQSEPPSVPMA
jgi:nucleoside-diphosphate-sugar epimerase